MVEDCKIDSFAAPSQSARSAIVGFARPGVPAGMVVGEDHPGAAEAKGIGHNLAHWDANGRQLARILLDMEATGCAVDMGDQQMFTGLILAIEASGEKAPRSLMTVE